MHPKDSPLRLHVKIIDFGLATILPCSSFSAIYLPGGGFGGGTVDSAPQRGDGATVREGDKCDEATDTRRGAAAVAAAAR